MTRLDVNCRRNCDGETTESADPDNDCRRTPPKPRADPVDCVIRRHARVGERGCEDRVQRSQRHDLACRDRDIGRHTAVLAPPAAGGPVDAEIVLAPQARRTAPTPRTVGNDHRVSAPSPATPRPSSTTLPAVSWPRMNGTSNANAPGAACMKWRSVWHRPTAATSTKTSPGAGLGTGISTNSARPRFDQAKRGHRFSQRILLRRGESSTAYAALQMTVFALRQPTPSLFIRADRPQRSRARFEHSRSCPSVVPPLLRRTGGSTTRTADAHSSRSHLAPVKGGQYAIGSEPGPRARHPPSCAPVTSSDAVRPRSYRS